MTFKVTPEMDAILESLAKEQHVPKSQVIRRAVMLLQYLDNPEREVQVTEKSTGRVQNLLFESQL